MSQLRQKRPPFHLEHGVKHNDEGCYPHSFLCLDLN